MAIRVALHHRTSYRFDRRVNLAPHEIRLRPAPHCRTPVLGYSLTTSPGQALPQLAAGPVRQLGRAARVPRARRQARDRRRPDGRPDGHQSVRLLRRAVRRALSVRVRAGARQGADPVPRDRAAGPAARGVARRLPAHDPAGRDRRCSMLVRLNQQLQQQIRYLVRMEPGVQAPDDTLAQRAGLLPRQRLAARADRCATSGSPRASPRAT